MPARAKKKRKLNPSKEAEEASSEKVEEKSEKGEKIIFRKLNFIGVVSGEKFILHIPPNYRASPSNLTVNHLKQVLESVFQLPIKAQIVGWNGFILNNNDERLEAIGVKNDDSFVVAVDEEILQNSFFSPNSSLVKRRNTSFGSQNLSQHALFSDASDEDAVAARAREILQNRASELSNQLSGVKRMQSIRRAGSGSAGVFQICPTTLENLVEMGFNRNAGIRALIMHRNKLELALDWLTEHTGDTTINSSVQAGDYPNVDLSAVLLDE